MATSVYIEDGLIKVEVRDGNGVGFIVGEEGRDSVDYLIKEARAGLREGQAKEIARLAELVAELEHDLQQVKKDRDALLVKRNELTDTNQRLRAEIRAAQDTLLSHGSCDSGLTLSGNIAAQIASLRKIIARQNIIARKLP